MLAINQSKATSLRIRLHTVMTGFSSDLCFASQSQAAKRSFQAIVNETNLVFSLMHVCRSYAYNKSL